MDFELSEDRRMLRESLSRWLADRYPPDHRLKVAYDAPFHDPALWSELADLGVLLAMATEDAGGFGGSGFDISVIFEALGAALCPEPVLGALLVSRLLAAAGQDQSGLLDGSVRWALAVGEPDAPWSLDRIATQARGGRLTGRKALVYGGNDADRFLVVARDGDRLSVHEIAASDAEVVGFGTIDGGGAADVILSDTPARLVLDDAGKAIQSALDAGRLALCAEAVGVMDASFAALLDYLRQRKQFGRAIGEFQALQHRAADLAVEIEQARSITLLAASRLDGEGAARMVSMAKNLIGRVGRQVAEECTQMTGGIGVTWDYHPAHLTKRLVMIDHQLGDTDWHLQQVMAGIRA
ncbi:acyl-CoA dehydrogenase [Paracoccus sp. M683]|uniref:acyl-CoA dehydrogenase family protein n=1 Tax=Paracoccus sp. M683 TaxID=2594268 RepID=UPI00117C4AA2|nr:acyl-CoA dehydrogenase family protein [Paracoccus sp. M683]TRW97810.1 acyl-CoA dehydrogenase [Paracoccus sp. M683]